MKEKFKVVPNLTISSRELTDRLKNRSIVIQQDGKTYNMEDEIERTRRLSKVELHREYVKGLHEVEAAKSQLKAIADRNAKKEKVHYRERAVKAEQELKKVSQTQTTK